MKKILLAALFVSGCRTEINSAVRSESGATVMRPGEVAECRVFDYQTATEVPSGAKNLGWVQVPTQENEELTIELLRKKVCEIGGDAMSQTRWIRASGSSVASPPIELEGNAWSLP